MQVIPRIASFIVMQAFIAAFLLSAGAAHAEAKATVLITSWFPERNYSQQVRTMADYLAGRGLRRGEDFQIEYHQVQSQQAFDALLASRSNARTIIVSNGSGNAEFVFANGTRAPHVFSVYSDPVEKGWAASYVNPGGNATGLVEYVPMHAKRLAILRELAPQARRIAILSSGERTQPDLEAAAAALRQQPGIEVSVMHVAPTDGAADIASRLRAGRVQAAYVPLSAGASFEEVSDAVYGALSSQRIPSVAERQFEVVRGKGLMALQVDRSELYTRAAHAVGLILAGVPAGRIPLQSPRRFMLTVNLDVARELGVAVPRGLLRQAERVISNGR